MKSIILLPLALLGTACGASYEWREVRAESDLEYVWGRFMDTASVSGYSADPLETDRGLRKFASKWREQPAPFRMGRRTKLVAEFDRNEDGPGWTIRFAIPLQVVSNIEASFEPLEEDWSDEGQDGEREDILQGQLRLAFGQSLGIQPTYDRR